MNMSAIQLQLGLCPLVEPLNDCEIKTVIVADILSDVLVGTPKGSLLVTSQRNLNVVAVACHVGIPSVIFSCGIKPENNVIEIAGKQGVALYSSVKSTFEVAGILYALGLRGAGQ